MRKTDSEGKESGSTQCFLKLNYSNSVQVVLSIFIFQNTLELSENLKSFVNIKIGTFMGFCLPLSREI